MLYIQDHELDHSLISKCRNCVIRSEERSEERHELGESSRGKTAKKGGRGRKTAQGSGVTRGKVRERSPAGRRPTVRRAGGKGRLVAEPNSAERQVSHENQLQVQMA